MSIMRRLIWAVTTTTRGNETRKDELRRLRTEVDLLCYGSNVLREQVAHSRTLLNEEKREVARLNEVVRQRLEQRNDARAMYDDQAQRLAAAVDSKVQFAADAVHARNELVAMTERALVAERQHREACEEYARARLELKSEREEARRVQDRVSQIAVRLSNAHPERADVARADLLALFV